MPEKNLWDKTNILHPQIYNSRNDIALGFEVGVLKSLHKQKLLSDEQLHTCIELLVEKYRKMGKDL